MQFEVGNIGCLTEKIIERFVGSFGSGWFENPDFRLGDWDGALSVSFKTQIPEVNIESVTYQQ
jgi:hypothetical protein